MTIGCPDCGTLQGLPPLPRGTVASCAGCGNPLERWVGRSTAIAFSLSASVLLLYTAANLLPFLRVGLAGREQQSRIGSVVPALLDSEWVLIAVGVGAFVVVLPIVRHALLAVTLGSLRLGRRPAWLGKAFRWALLLELWSMPDVLLAGAVIGYTRMSQYLAVEIAAGGWCLLAAAGLAMVANATLDRRTVWRAIAPDRPAPHDAPAISCSVCDLVVPASAEGSACPRCGARLDARKPDALVRTSALVLAGLMLYPAANLYPMTTVTRLGETQSHTILSSVLDLVGAGLLPLAALIFFTSFAIPILKLPAIAWFVISIRLGSRALLGFRTRLYRTIDGLGRWSMLDVMIIAVFAPLTQFGQLATAHFGVGAAFFFAVVVVTMLASRAFDARLMWDAAERRP